MILSSCRRCSRSAWQTNWEISGKSSSRSKVKERTPSRSPSSSSSFSSSSSASLPLRLRLRLLSTAARSRCRRTVESLPPLKERATREGLLIYFFFFFCDFDEVEEVPRSEKKGVDGPRWWPTESLLLLPSPSLLTRKGPACGRAGSRQTQPSRREGRRRRRRASRPRGARGRRPCFAFLFSPVDQRVLRNQKPSPANEREKKRDAAFFSLPAPSSCFRPPRLRFIWPSMLWVDKVRQEISPVAVAALFFKERVNEGRRGAIDAPHRWHQKNSMLTPSSRPLSSPATHTPPVSNSLSTAPRASTSSSSTRISARPCRNW